MESMTGYANIEKSNSHFSFSIEIKSLNSKFLETYVNLPKLLKKEENEIGQILKDKFRRGKVVLTIEIFNWVDERSISINKDLIKKLYTEIKSIEKELKVDNFFSGDALFSFDNIKHFDKITLSSEWRTDIMKTLESVIEKTIKMRLKEGSATKKDIQNSLNVISLNLNLITRKYKNISQVIFNKLKKNIEMLAGSEVNDVRLYTEVAILADKMDINEEIVRLGDHIKKFKLLMNEKDQVGKRLDFLAQEMFREINTISSKSNSSDISQMVVDIKNNLDKIREQSRNIV
jgi:uncharacterized protein (TIGR00255 family)